MCLSSVATTVFIPYCKYSEAAVFLSFDMWANTAVNFSSHKQQEQLHLEECAGGILSK